MKPLIVYVTTAGRQEADTIARHLVAERLAACCTVIDPVASVYRWQGRVETGSEVLMMIKTMSSRYRELEKRVRELHSYETPEIIAVALYAGDRDYLLWMQGETAGEIPE